MCEPRRILVCEVKLRMPTNTSKGISIKEVNQLVDAVESVRKEEYIQSRKHGYSYTIIPFLISNANIINEDAKLIASANKVTIMSAQLPDKWYWSSDWIIRNCVKVNIKPPKKSQ